MTCVRCSTIIPNPKFPKIEHAQSRPFSEASFVASRFFPYLREHYSGWGFDP